MDDAWWGASFLTEGGAAAVTLWERSLPGSLIVGADGKRFANESESYVDFGQMPTKRGTVPAWLVLDSRHRKHYLFMQLYPGRTPQSAIDSGFSVKAASLQELAARGGEGGRTLGTVERVNGFAATGVDEDFGRAAAPGVRQLLRRPAREAEPQPRADLPAAELGDEGLSRRPRH